MDGNGQDAYNPQPVLPVSSQVEGSEVEGSETRDPQSEISPEALQRAWARRAARVAQVIVEEDQGEQLELVLIQLGRGIYGLEAQYVFDIRPLERLTHLPRVPDWVTGVINVRGRVLSVLDLQRFLGLPRLERNGDDGPATLYRVVVETPDMELALLADAVLAVEALPVDKIQDATSAVRGIRPEYVRGIVERGSLLVILDLPVLLADEQLIVNEEVT